MDLQLKDRTALVTGASAGIGRGIALALGAEGVRLALAARRRKLLHEVAAEIVAQGGHAPVIIECDLMQEDAAERIASAALAGLGSVDILVNNAGGSRAFKLDAGEAQWNEALTLNFTRQRQIAHRLLWNEVLVHDKAYGRSRTPTRRSPGSGRPRGGRCFGAAPAGRSVAGAPRGEAGRRARRPRTCPSTSATGRSPARSRSHGRCAARARLPAPSSTPRLRPWRHSRRQRGIRSSLPGRKIELMLTIEPERFGTITRAASRAARKDPVRLTSITDCQSASECSSSGLSNVVPALLTRMSMVPNASTAAATSPTTLRSSETSAGTATASTPCCSRSSDATCSSSCPPRGDDDARACLRKTVRELLPQSVGGAGDDRDSTVEAVLRHQRAVTSAYASGLRSRKKPHSSRSRLLRSVSISQ